MEDVRAHAEVAAAAVIACDASVMATRSDPKLTSMGFEVANSFTINESEPVAGPVREYELLANDKLVWTGVGDDRGDALLEAIAQVTDQGDDLPDN